MHDFAEINARFFHLKVRLLLRMCVYFFKFQILPCLQSIDSASWWTLHRASDLLPSAPGSAIASHLGGGAIAFLQAEGKLLRDGTLMDLRGD